MALRIVSYNIRFGGGRRLERIAEAEDLARMCMASQPGGFRAQIEAGLEPAKADLELFLEAVRDALTQRGLSPGGAITHADA